ncbi:hypothetical protein ABZ260_01660 [Streptosporangium sp. NPDC006013]|uniref:hypothetical protein n=1 Tax=Streptosporangium sp. NPDC006013 TaxID=3155596 RepID=UPI0033BCF810
MRILVTGGAGLTGSRQVCALARGASVAVPETVPETMPETVTVRRCRGGRARPTDPVVRT